MHTTINYFDKAKISEYDNVEVLYLAYNMLMALPNEVFSLPKLHTIAFGNEQISQENWIKFISQISQNLQIKHLYLACFPDFPADITPLKQLISLEISFDKLQNSRESQKDPKDKNSFENFAKQLSQLPNLETLNINLAFGYGGLVNIAPEVFNAIGNIKSLQNLKIGALQMENYHFGKLKYIKKLELCTKNAQFPDDFNEMESLEELHLFDVNLKHLHLTTALKNLHTITFNFTYNKRYINSFESISNDFLHLLPQIKNLELSNIPKSGNTKLLTDLHQIFQQNNAKNALQNNDLILDIITQNNTEKYEIKDLLTLLSIKKAQIDNLTWVIIEKRLKENAENNIQKNVFDLDKVKTYFLLGKSTRSLDLRKILKSLGWKATKNSENADCIVVSRGYANANNANASEAGANVHFDAQKAVSDTYLFAWAEEKMGVERFDEGMNTNLLLLLKSENTENQSLGIDLLTNAYTSTPEIDACLLAIALFTTNKNLREKTKKFIEKNLSSNLLTQYKKHNRRGHEKETYEIIKNSPQIDALSFAEVAFLAVKHKRGYEKFGFMDILQLGGEMMPKAIESLQYYVAQIEIPLDIAKLHPDFVTYFPADYDSVVCHNPLPAVQEVLFKLKTIKEITFDYFRTDFLHEDIGNMRCLERIELNINIQNFPKNLSKLTQIKQLVLNNDEITTIPDAFSTWKNLENLRLFTKNLVTIPDWISDFKKLKMVQIFSVSEQMNVAPLFEIENLEELYLRATPFTFKNQNLSKLKKFSFNSISTTNSDIALHNVCLQDLISVLPADLEEFTFESNFFSTIPNEIQKFTKLKKLNLRGSFDKFPTYIPVFPLETLCLQSDNLTEFPAFLKNITTLKLVELSSNFKKQEKKLRKMMPNIDFWI